MKLGIQRAKVSLLRMVTAIKRQYAPTLATIVMATGGCLDTLYEIVEDGRQRLRSKHLAVIAANGSC